MDTAEQLEIYQSLRARVQAIARAWFDMLTQLTAVSLNAEQLMPRLEEYVERLTSLLISEPFNPDVAQSAAQDVGKGLDVVDNLQPKDIVKIQECLASELMEGLPVEQAVALQPRVVGVLAALEAGFFMGKMQRAKLFDMESMSKMGHDLKTPINAITGFSRVILKGIDGPITEFQQQDLTSIFEAGKKLLDMINDTFEVAKSDAGKTDLYDDSFDVADLLGDVMRTAQPILAKRQHGLELQATGDLGKMQADASQARWVLLSLLFHAARLTEKGMVSLSAERERVEKLDWLLFEITKVMVDQPLSFDTSLASPVEAAATEAALQPIVEEADNDMEIGLITALRFCKEMGGSLAISDAKQGMAKFSVRLPARVIVPE